MHLSYLSSFLETFSPDIVTLGIRALIYEFWDMVHFIAQSTTVLANRGPSSLQKHTLTHLPFEGIESYEFSPEFFLLDTYYKLNPVTLISLLS